MKNQRLSRTIFCASLFASGLSPSPLFAGVHLGLGNAVAQRSADLIEKASRTDPANAVGDNAAALLESCGSSSIYDSPPLDLNTIGGIDPLGHVNPSGHTFPSDHIYFYTSTTTAYTPNVYAPGAIHVTSIATTEYLDASPPFIDYSVTFYACRDVKSFYGHVRTISTGLSAKAGPIDQACFTYTTGGSRFRRCSKNMNVTMASGEWMGALATSGTLDFGSYDYRVPRLAFVSPARHYIDQAYTVCPIDYFSTGPQATMRALLGRFDGGYRRTTPPVCGQINYDVANTARGYWFHPGSSDTPEDPHLALIVNNVYAPQETISIGTSLPNFSSNFWTFSPASSGWVDREFSQVTSNGQIYCYDTFYDPIGQTIFSGPTFLIDMPTASTLRIEKQNATTCGAGPWAFTTNAVTFQR